MKALRIAQKILAASAAALAPTFVLGRGLALIGAYPSVLGWELEDVLVLPALVSALGMAGSAIAWVFLRTWVSVAKRRAAA
jgi:hypothetical protein